MFKLIIIDDEKKTREGLLSIIPWKSFDVEVAGTASDGEEGLALAKAVKPDIIITDVRMPRMDGIHFSNEIRKTFPLCQIIFISGYSDKEYLKSAISLKAVSYVEKPIDIDEIKDAVKTAVLTVEEGRKNQKIIEQSQTMYEKNIDILGEKIALELVSLSSNNSFVEKLNMYHPSFSKTQSYCTIICQLNYITESDDDDKKAYALIKSVLNSSLSSFLLAQKQPHIFIIHLCDQKLQYSESMHLLISHIYSQIKESVAAFATPFIAVGNYVSELDQISQSYMNAVICLKKLFFTGYNTICYFQNHDVCAETPFVFDNSNTAKFSKALKTGNKEEAKDIITKLSFEIRKSENKFKINGIKDIYYQLLMEMANICEERSISNVFSQGKDFIWERISEKDTLFALNEYLTDKLALYFDEIASKEKVRSLVYAIQRYIELHFSELDLSINKIAQHLHFTPAYLCQVYKNETGLTINAYITNFRIEKAKALLKSKDMKLIEISIKIGYSDANYFTRLFKKNVGVTPSDFRENYIL